MSSSYNSHLKIRHIVYTNNCLQGSNELNEMLLKEINERGTVYMVPSKVKGSFFLRMAICSRYTEIKDIDVTWNEVNEAGKTVLSKQ